MKSAGEDKIDLLLINANVVTLNANHDIQQAVGIAHGRIVATGAATALLQHAGSRTIIHDLEGRTVLPGFFAAHDHLVQYANLRARQADLRSPPIGKVRSMTELQSSLAAHARRTQTEKWIQGFGYDDTLLQEKRHPTRHDLDVISTDRAVLITHVSGHIVVANSKALELAGITRDTPPPPSGLLHKDPQTGEPNGILEECGQLVSHQVPIHTDPQGYQSLLPALREYAAKGITTSVFAGAWPGAICTLKEALTKDDLSLRVILMPFATDPEIDEILQGIDRDWLRGGATKIFHDGSIQGYTAYLREPYFRTPAGLAAGYPGYAGRSREELTKQVIALHRAGKQIAIHGNGDAGIDDILAAYAAAQRDCPRPDARHRVEHAQMTTKDQLDTMHRLGVTPSFFNAHVFYWGDRHRDIFLGPERAARISPLAGAIEHGLRFTLHNDTPVTPPDPLFLVWTAVNRFTTTGTILGAAQRISVEQALRAVTIDAAWQNFEENNRGTIEPGKLADLVILDRSPLTIQPEAIRDIQVCETIVGGRTVFAAA